MLDQNFGHKELYEVVLRAKTPMQFGSRMIEEQEPVLYFNSINMSLLSESNSPIFARGGWANMPRVIWDDRKEVTFQLGPMELNEDHELYLQHWPVDYKTKKTFIFEYERDNVQKKVYGKRIEDKKDPFDDTQIIPCLQVFEDKNLSIPADISKQYVVDYYYKYEDEALIYSVQKERFNGLFTLEAKFYSKDENEGENFTNVLFMPKVRVVSNINLRLGERADPTVSSFNVIGLPETVGDKKNLIMEIIRLSKDIDGDI